MAQIQPNNEATKQALKEALAETMHEQRELLHEVFAEVLEDFALAEAVREGRQTEHADRAMRSSMSWRVERKDCFPA